jgi:hypothetical protein
VPNSYVANAFSPIFDRKITVIPACVNVGRKNSYARRYFGLDDDRFYFKFSFDYYSGTARKNPWEWRKPLDMLFLIRKQKLDFYSSRPARENWIRQFHSTSKAYQQSTRG